MALDDDIRRMNEIALFRQLDGDALRLLTFSAEQRLLRAGGVLFREGDQSDGAYLLTKGAIDLRAARDPAARRFAPVVLLGELALITQTARPATAIAADHSTVLRISRKLFHRVLEEFPSCAARIRDMVEVRLASYAADLRHFAEEEPPVTGAGPATPARGRTAAPNFARP